MGVCDIAAPFRDAYPHTWNNPLYDKTKEMEEIINVNGFINKEADTILIYHSSTIKGLENCALPNDFNL